MNHSYKNKIVVILGPTASGKSDLAVELAIVFAGEVISADSRQIYQGLDIATGKITETQMRGIPHHLLSIADPNETYTAAQFKRDADRAIVKIFQKNKLPILCGGTGFYIWSVVENILLPDVPPNTRLREALEKEETKKLLQMLEKKDPDRVKNIDSNNRPRIIRSIEIADALGKVPKIEKGTEKYEVLQIGLHMPAGILKDRIAKRTRKRLKKGMIEEAQELMNAGLTHTRMRTLGLEYRHLADHLAGKISKSELIDKIITGDQQYAKRQMTWFSRDRRVHWIDYKNSEAAKKLTRAFLK